MKQSEMLKELKELHSVLLRYAAGSDSIVPRAYVEALDAAIETLDRIRWRKVEDELPEENDPARSSAHVLQCIKVTTSYGWYRFATDAHCFPISKDVWKNATGTRTTHWAYLPELPEEENDG